MRRFSIFLVLMVYFFCAAIDESSIRILIKIPTRSRPDKFFSCLDKYYDLLSKKYKYTFLIACDEDDHLMNNESVINKLKKYENLLFGFDKNSTKVSAYNSGIDKVPFDILIVTSDDLIPIVKNYDELIVKAMLANFPDTDGVLNYHDGTVGAALNTYPILGRKYYERFGYVYHPHYKSLFCDNEFGDISKMLKREYASNQVLFLHHHPLGNWAINKYPMDESSKKNEALDPQDRLLRKIRREINYNYNVERNSVIKWSILIPTLNNRRKIFNTLRKKLIGQIKSLGLENSIEILSYVDDGKLSTGYKRNVLLRRSMGEYVSFVDDDDDVCNDFISFIYRRLKKFPDCVSLNGVITVDGKNPKTFIHSLRYKDFFEKDNVYYRPSNHLNPMRRDIAVRFKFPDKYISEDSSWAMQICESNLLQTEESVDRPYYFYRYSSRFSVQAMGKK